MWWKMGNSSFDHPKVANFSPLKKQGILRNIHLWAVGIRFSSELKTLTESVFFIFPLQLLPLIHLSCSFEWKIFSTHSGLIFDLFSSIFLVAPFQSTEDLSSLFANPLAIKKKKPRSVRQCLLLLQNCYKIKYCIIWPNKILL